MKLNQLVKIIKPTLLELGFTYFPHKITWAGGVFCKKEPNDMFLTLGITMDRFYDFSYTFDLYYSTVTKIGSVYGDIPFECDTRSDWILTKEDRQKLELPKEPEAFWWDSTDPKTIKTIQMTIAIAEKRLLKNKELMDKVKKSSTIMKLQKIYLDIINIADNAKFNINREYNFVPKKATSSIPVIWFQAAEIICKKYYGKINKNSVYWSAGDAYRIYTLNKMQDGE